MKLTYFFSAKFVHSRRGRYIHSFNSPSVCVLRCRKESMTSLFSSQTFVSTSRPSPKKKIYVSRKGDKIDFKKNYLPKSLLKKVRQEPKTVWRTHKFINKFVPVRRGASWACRRRPAHPSCAGAPCWRPTVRGTPAS